MRVCHKASSPPLAFTALAGCNAMHTPRDNSGVQVERLAVAPEHLQSTSVVPKHQPTRGNLREGLIRVLEGQGVTASLVEGRRQSRQNPVMRRLTLQAPTQFELRVEVSRLCVASLCHWTSRVGCRCRGLTTAHQPRAARDRGFDLALRLARLVGCSGLLGCALLTSG